MIKYSIIQKSQLEGALRLDAEYYINPSILGEDFYVGHEVVDLVQYGTSKELNEEGLGYPVLRLNEFDGWFIGSPAKYCDKISHQIFEQLKLGKGDILICRTNGNPQLVGKSAIVLDDTEIAFASYLFRVRTKNKYINSETLLAYINSKFGRQEIEKYFMISNQTNFSPAKFKEIKIPKFSSQSQNEIKKLVNGAYRENTQWKDLYSQAENLLLEELGLKDFEDVDDLSYEINLSEIKFAHRADAEYFQPKYKRLIEIVKKGPDTPELREIFDFRRGAFISTTYYTEEKTRRPYIRIKELSKRGGIDEEKIIFVKESYPEDTINKLKEDDLIIAIIGDTIGKTNKINYWKSIR